MTLVIKVSKRAKRPSLRYENKSVSLVWPYRLGKRRLTLFLEEKSDWITETQEKLLAHGLRSAALLSQKNLNESEIAWCREEAKKALDEYLPHYLSFYQVRNTGLTLRDMKTRWGSCSGKGRLTFSLKMAYLPDNLRRYLIVHEVCHLKEMNHGSAFWELVKMSIEKPKESAKLLREYKIPSNIE